MKIGLTPSQLDMEWQLHLKKSTGPCRSARLTCLHSFRDANPFTLPWALGAAEAEGRRVWLAEQVELPASSICPPRSPAVARHATVTMLTTLCFLRPRKSGPATPWVLVILQLTHAKRRRLQTKKGRTTSQAGREASGAATPGFLALRPLCAVMPPTMFREFLLPVAARKLSLWVASPGVLSQPPLTRGSVFRVAAPLFVLPFVKRQEATDPQSPKGGSQRACHTKGAHPTASGRLGTEAVIKQSALL